MRTRQPVVAGQFYPADPVVLRQQVTDYLQTSGVHSDRDVTGIISPHAGYIYSGSIAGKAFSAAPDTIETVIVIAPSHRFPLRTASVFSESEYITPLGAVPVDQKIVEKLIESGLEYQPEAHRYEHSAEVQVPFIQLKYPGASLVVIIQGDQSGTVSRELANRIKQALILQDNFLLVASSDLSHFHPLSVAQTMDGRLIKAFENCDPEKIEDLLSSGASEACGGGPVMTLLYFSRLAGGFSCEKITYDTSATVSGDTGSVVGYLAGAIRRIPE